MAHPPSQPATAKIFMLPPELMEQTLIFSALGGFPAAIACLGRTCRYFHQLIYRSGDNHLWREVFLTTFDDPRPLLGRLRAATTFFPTGNLEKDVEFSFDWAEEFMQRLDAKRLFKGFTEGNGLMSVDHEPEHPSPLSRVLRTLLSALESSTPFSSHRHDDFTAITPTFPPIIILHASPLPFPEQFKSLNSAWVEDILKKGYPPDLIQRFLLDGHQRRQRRVKGSEEVVWEISEEGRLFHKLVFLKGFIPIPQPLLTAETSPLAAELDKGECNNSPLTFARGTQASAAEQMAAARKMARSRVYNLQYLMPERCWGPFLPSNGKAGETILHTRFPDFEELTRNMSNVNRPSDLIEITSNGDIFYPFLTVDGSDSYREDSHEDDNEDEDEALDEEEDNITFVINGHVPDVAFVPPKPHQVAPDYAFLSAARLLVEMNLREILGLATDDQAAENYSIDASVSRIVDAFACLDLMRMGGAPSFWNENWVLPVEKSEYNEESRPTSEKAKGKRKASDSDVGEFHGWDWAGVTGEWKRSVCWLDYRDLLLHNLTGFPSENLEETMRIFPMTLRVSGYSPPPEPDPTDSPSSHELDSLVWKLPVIHVEGESKGSDIDPSVMRQVRGHVRMIGDGAVRWSLTSSYPGDSVPEWLTEGVQIGSIGSAVGMIGMWTGAEHASTDPLGPVWAWKVA